MNPEWFPPLGCTTPSGTPYTGTITLSAGPHSLTLNYQNIEFNGYYKGKILNQQYTPQYSPFGVSILQGMITPPRWIFNFQSIYLTEPDMVKLINMQGWSQAEFANRRNGAITLIDNWQNPFVVAQVVLTLPEDLFSNLVGPLLNNTPTYKTSFTAIEL